MIALGSNVDQFRARVLAQALLEALPAYWLRRAAQFEAACPGPGDFPGLATGEDLERARLRLTGWAESCRRHAKAGA